MTVTAPRSGKVLFWLVLLLAAGGPRILAAFLLPNAFGDAYSYLQIIEGMRAKIVAGNFFWKDLYGFWLPLYQFVCASLSTLLGPVYFISKLVAAITGIGTCVLVYLLTREITKHRTVALLGFIAIAFNPMHILYSGSALTDIPHALLVLGSLYFAMKNKWMTAAILATGAGLIRIESWMLILILPLLQMLYERRVFLFASCLPIISPLFLLFISYRATGKWLAYFIERNRYIIEYKAGHPAVTFFSFERILTDAGRLLYTTNSLVLLSCLAAVGLIGRQIINRKFSGHFNIVAALIFFFANFGFLLLAYLTGNQPDIWERYGLIFFALGLPILAWVYLRLTEAFPARRRSIAIILLIFFSWQFVRQLQDTYGFVNQFSAQQKIADFLREKSQQSPDFRAYCEDLTIQFISGISAEKFISAANLPGDSSQTLAKLRENAVEYFVYENIQGSPELKLFPELRDGTGNGNFLPLQHASSNFFYTDIWVFKIQSSRVEK